MGFLDSLSLQGNEFDQSRPRLDDAQWLSVASALPRHIAARARHNKQDYRCFIEAVIWVASSRAFWSELPSEYGSWRATYVRYVRWYQASVWSRVVAALGHDSYFSFHLVRLLDQHDNHRLKRHLSNARKGVVGSSGHCSLVG